MILSGSVDPRFSGLDISARIHPQQSTSDKENRDELRNRKPTSNDPIVLRANELDYESLHPGKHTIQSEQPTLRVLVIAVTPENQKHHEAERHFVKLGGMHRDNFCRGDTWGKLDAENL